MAELIKPVEVVTEEQVDGLLKTINTRFNKTLQKAETFLQSAVSLGDACTQLKSVLTKHKKVLLGNTKMDDYINSKKADLGFGYSQFQKYTKIFKNRDMLTKCAETSSNDFLIEHKELGAVPATIDNFDRIITIENKSETDPDKKSRLELALEELEKIKKDLDDSILQKYEGNKKIFAESEKTIEDLENQLNTEKDKLKEAKAVLLALPKQYKDTKAEAEAEAVKAKAEKEAKDATQKLASATIQNLKPLTK